MCLNASTLSDEQVSDAVLVYRNRHTAGRWVPNDTQVELKNGTPYACDTGLSLSGDFTIAGGNISQLATPALIAPANESNVGELIPRLQWAPVGGVAQYQVQVSVTPTFTILEMNIAGLANTEFDTNLSEPFVPYFWRVRGQDSDGTWGPWSEPWVFVATNVLVDTEDEAELPDTFVLDQNHPNPFNPQTTLGYSLPEASRVRIVVYDALGREVRVLVDGVRPAGRYEAVFNAGPLSSGVYFYRMTAGSEIRTGRMVLLK